MKLVKEKYLIIIIIALGFILRIWGINFGLPYQFHQDEPIIVNHALAYGSGDLNPHFFIIPPFCSYILFILYGIYYLLGRAFGMFAHIDDFALQFFANPNIFYLIARIALGIIPGTLSIWLCYVLYKRLFNEKGAVYAAAIMTFSFLCVINSHYAYADNLMLAFVLLTYIYIIKMIGNPSLKSYSLSAVFLGLAAGTKYNAGLLAISFYIAHIIIILNGSFDKKRIIFDRYLWTAVCISLLTFVITNPFSLLDWQFFLSSVPGMIRRHYMGWTHHISYSLYQGIGAGILMVGLLGLAAILFKEKRTKSVFFLSFPLVFYLHLVLKSQRFSRYALPLMPFFAICTAFFVFRILLPRAKNLPQKVMVIFLATALLIPTAIKSIKSDSLFSAEDTRITCTDWIERNIPQYTKIAVDHTSFRPQIAQTREQILQKYVIIGLQQGLKKAKEKKLEFLLKTIGDKKTYNIYFLTHKNKEVREFLLTVPTINYDMDSLAGNGINYIVINYNTINKEKKDFIKRLREKGDVVAEFSPYYDKKIRQCYDNTDATFMAIGSKELFSRRATGPCLVIYKIKALNKQ